MTITNRDELIEEFKSELKRRHPNIGAIYYDTAVEAFEHALDWFSEQGFALVPLKPTEEILSIAYDESGASEVHDGQEIISMGVTAANEAADLLKRRE